MQKLKRFALPFIALLLALPLVAEAGSSRAITRR